MHIGNERSDYASGNSFIHSDTLYSAIAWAWNMLGKPEWIDHVPNEGIHLSSCFPFEQSRLFYPRPQFSYEINREILVETSVKKKIKKAEWVDEKILTDILSGREPIANDKKNFSGGFWSTDQFDKNDIIGRSVIPRVMVPRNNEDTKIYYIEKFFFKEDSGLYFIAKFKSEVEKKQLESALKLLSEEGFGTDRNVGHGKFDFIVEQFELPNIKPSSGLMYSLGLLIPKDRESMKQMMSHPQKGYGIMKRGGWLSEPYLTWKKRHVHMFTEGSVFKSLEDGNIVSNGRTVDLRPVDVKSTTSHPIWRCGRTLLLNF